jgi:hypothetical protein
MSHAIRNEPQTTLDQWVHTARLDIASVQQGAEEPATTFFSNRFFTLMGDIASGRLLANRVQGAHRSAIADVIDREIRPQLLEAEKHLSKEDAALVKKWRKLGLPESVLANERDCARCLVNTKTIFTMVGLQNSSPNAERCIRIDEEGHALFKIEGRWAGWGEISGRLQFNEKLSRWEERNHSEKVWCYVSPQGFVPLDRRKQCFPVHQITEDQYREILTQAEKFLDTNPVPKEDKDKEKNYIIQFNYSVENNQIPNWAVFDNLRKMLPAHIGMRLITPDNQVFSFGFSIDPGQIEQMMPGGSMFTHHIATTTDAQMEMGDYQEFRPFNERVTTSIPIPQDRAQAILDFITEFQSKQRRFNYKEQNCSAPVKEIFNRTGYGHLFPDTRTSLGMMALKSLPSPSVIPVIGPIIEKVIAAFERAKEWIIDMLPKNVLEAFEWIVYIITYIPRKIGTILENLFILAVGGTKMSTPLDNPLEDPLGGELRVKNISCLIQDWTDIFKDETATVYHVGPFLDWMRLQPSTFVTKKSDTPRLFLSPEVRESRPLSPTKQIPV